MIGSGSAPATYRFGVRQAVKTPTMPTERTDDRFDLASRIEQPANIGLMARGGQAGEGISSLPFVSRIEPFDSLYSTDGGLYSSRSPGADRPRGAPVGDRIDVPCQTARDLLLTMSSAQSLPERRRISIDGHPIDYAIRRHGRAKHMRLNVSPFDGVTVTLPSRLPRYVDTDRFVRENGAWVLEQMKTSGLLDRRPGVPPLDASMLRSGSRIPYRGEQYTLVVQRLAVAHPFIRRDTELRRIAIYLPRSEAWELEDVLRDWLRERAVETINRVATQEARRIGLRYNRLSVRNLKSKWGSCSSRGDLVFNWRLVLFPPSILRYVIVHELCHLRHFDHSIRFWRLVARHDPDYHDAVEWLKHEGVNARNLLTCL